MELTFLSLPSEFSSKEKVKLKDLPMPRDQEDLDQREPLTLEKLLSLERPMMSESTLSEDKLERRMERLSTKPQMFKDSSPRRELEERFSTEETELTPGKPTKRLTSLMRNSSLNILRKRKPPRKPLSQLQQLPQLKPLQLKPLQLKLLQPKPLQPMPLPLLQPRPERKERSECINNHPNLFSEI